MRETLPNQSLPKSASLKRAEDAIARWVTALNTQGEAAEVAAAVAPNARIERHGIGARREDVVEIIDGVENVGRWMALSPEGTTFSAIAVHEPDSQGLIVARYAIEVAGFHNGGGWSLRLDGDGRVAWLKHQPDSLSDPSVGEVRDPSEAWRNYVVDVPTHHHRHDHDGDHADETGGGHHH